MATKKKAKKKSAKPKRGASGKAAITKKRVPAGKTPKKPRKKSSVRSKAAGGKKGVKSAARGKTVSARNNEVPKKRPGRSASAFSGQVPEPRSGQESGDLQGLSDVESADSESVDELIEDGDAFEAGVISGVEAADGEDEREVHTHEVPEDDVPSEYLDDSD
ncbi:MAG: hypothetical protein WAK89_03725 [Candidatus Sulfotelmatobacter sp.]